MLNQDVASQLVPGRPLPLHARLRDRDVSPWYEVGTVARPRVAGKPLTVRLAEDATLLWPVWDAAIGPALPEGIPVFVDFAIPSTDHLARLAEVQLTRVVAREVEKRVPRVSKPILGGPKSLRSNWPSDAFIAAIRRY